MEQQLLIRPLELEMDFPSLVRLLSTVERFDRDGEDTSEAGLHQQLAAMDPGCDCWVVEAPGNREGLLGYASALAQTPERAMLYIAVDPTWRRKHLGTVLLTRVLERARQRGAASAGSYANAKNRPANAFLQRRGFAEAGSAWMMLAAADISVEEPVWPAGYTVRNCAQVADLTTLPKALESYCDMWGHAENTRPPNAESVMRWLPKRNPEGIFLAFAPDGPVAGICQAQVGVRQDERGNSADLVDAPGILPEHRGHGLERSLVLLAMQWLRSQGKRAIALESWGDNPRTAAAYEQAGFRVGQHYVAYRRDLND